MLEKFLISGLGRAKDKVSPECFAVTRTRRCRKPEGTCQKDTAVSSRGSHWTNLSIKRKITILFNDSPMCREKGPVNLVL